MNDLFPFGALRIPRMMVAAAVDAACACLSAPLVLGHAQVRRVAPGAYGAGLAAIALVTSVTKPLAFVTAHWFGGVILKLECTMHTQVQLVWSCALEGHQCMPGFLRLAIHQTACCDDARYSLEPGHGYGRGEVTHNPDDGGDFVVLYQVNGMSL